MYKYTTNWTLIIIFLTPTYQHYLTTFKPKKKKKKKMNTNMTSKG